jgi:dedicator of cytokinesis protein 6/7/8
LHNRAMSLQFKLEQFEPFFCSVALYDVQHKKRISENFYFDLNPDKILDLLGE